MSCRRLMQRLFLLSLIIVLCSACSALKNIRGKAADSNPGGAQLISDIRPQIPGTKSVKMEISRKKYLQTLRGAGNLNRARLVEIYSRNRSNESIPEYRFFDIRKGSVYQLLGLETADILVGADGFVVPSVPLFWQYLNLIGQSNQQTASIEIKRGGQPIIFEYSFVE